MPEKAAAEAQLKAMSDRFHAERIQEQAALQDEVVRIPGLLHPSKKFLLAKQLHAQLIAPAALRRFVFQSCQNRCADISH